MSGSWLSWDQDGSTGMVEELAAIALVPELESLDTRSAAYCTGAPQYLMRHGKNAFVPHALVHGLSQSMDHVAATRSWDIPDKLLAATSETAPDGETEYMHIYSVGGEHRAHLRVGALCWDRLEPGPAPEAVSLDSFHHASEVVQSPEPLFQLVLAPKPTTSA